MAYQPKSYRKFLATSVAATMVATAVAPAAFAADAKEVSFSDVSENYRNGVGGEAIYTLANLEIVQGANGQFMPEANVTRGAAALMLARALGYVNLDGELLVDVEDTTLTGLYEGTPVYNAVSALQANNIVSGKADGSYGQDDYISRGAMAIMIAKAFELEANTDSNPFTDLGASSAEAVQALYDNEITQGTSANTFGTDDDIRRDDFAIFVYRGMVAAGLIADAGDLAVDSVGATGVSKVGVSFNQAVENTDDVTFELKRGSITQFANVEWNEDKTEATLKSNFAFPKADYTLTVGGLELAEDTFEFEIEAEAVTNIDFVTGSEIANAENLVVEYEVFNQYGEEMEINSNSDALTFVYSRDGFEEVNGEQQVKWDNHDLDEDDTFTVRIVHNATGVTAVQTFTVVEKATLSSFVLTNIELPEDEDGETVERIYAETDDTKVHFEAFDQYGNAIEEPGDAVRLVSSSDVVEATFQTDNDGNGYIELDVNELESASQNVTLTAIVRATGETSSVSFTVYQAAAADVATLSNPNRVIAENDTDVYLDLEVKDQFGNQLTKDQIVAQKDAIEFTSSSNSRIDEDNISIVESGDNKGRVLISEVDGKGDVTVTVTVGDNKTTLPIAVQEERHAQTVSVKSEPARYLLNNAYTDIEFSLKDQYGEDFDVDQGDYELEVKLRKVSGDEDALLADNSIGLDTPQTFAADELEKITLTADAADTGKFEVVATVTDGTTELSQVVRTLEVIAEKDTTLTFNVNEVGTIYAFDGNDEDSDYAKELTLYATNSAGSKVAIPSSFFEGISSSDTDVVGVHEDSNTIFGLEKGTATITVFVNTKDGIKTVQQTVTVAEDTLVAQSIDVVDGDDSVDELDINVNGAVDLADLLVVEDQFGGKTKLVDTVRYFVTNIDAEGNFEVSTADGNINLTESTAGDTFDVTVVTRNGLTKVVSFTVVE